MVQVWCSLCSCQLVELLNNPRRQRQCCQYFMTKNCAVRELSYRVQTNDEPAPPSIQQRGGADFSRNCDHSGLSLRGPALGRPFIRGRVWCQIMPIRELYLHAAARNAAQSDCSMSSHNLCPNTRVGQSIYGQSEGQSQY